MEDQVSVDKLVRVYLKIRTRIQTITKDYETALQELEDQKTEVANEMRERMKAMGSKSIKTDYGTVMMSVKTHYTTQDWDSFKNFVVKNDAVDLLEKRIAQRNMASFLESNPGLVPPGLNSDQRYDITVRKST
jgi:DNA-binding ferritin-like protein (Dps family)